ncbi:MAG: iron hydrogenase [Candidatus Pacebacteria bacterium]|nr:iron hydrogenase [Candidatus Paceibacterota bacterium]
MDQVKTIATRNEKILSIAKFVVLFAIAILAPLAQNQLITGTIVNATLFASVFVLGFGGAAAIAFFPSVISLGLGLLPAVMAPMAPFIVLGNLILISVFQLLKGKNYWLSAVSASVLKFAWLFAASQIIISLFIKKSVAANIAAMMGWPQLATALAGSILAYLFVFKLLKASKTEI